jgi:hypothetical protein
MIEFILDILFNYPEGISFALFGIKKKKKKAEKMMKQFDKGVPELDSLSVDTNSGAVPQFSETQRQTRASQAPTATSYKPVFPYRGKQIIIDSDRVLLNAKDDSVFILGDKAVGISTNGTFNIDSGGKTIINSPQIDLGLDAKHPIIKGDEFLAIFQQFLLVINQVTVPELEGATDSNDVKIASVNRAGEGLRKATEALSELLPGTLSDTVKTL